MSKLADFSTFYSVSDKVSVKLDRECIILFQSRKKYKLQNSLYKMSLQSLTLYEVVKSAIRLRVFSTIALFDQGFFDLNLKMPINLILEKKMFIVWIYSPQISLNFKLKLQRSPTIATCFYIMFFLCKNVDF